MYASAVLLCVTSLSVFLLRDVLFPAPTCVDGKRNGFELDVDCGGSCALRCSSEVTPFTVTWSKAIKASKDKYDLVAMINNTNIDNASVEVGYTFEVFDASARSMATFSGSTTAPLAGKFPVILQNISLPSLPSTVVVTLNDGPHFSVKESPSSPTIKVLDRRYEPGTIPRVYATIMNTKHKEITNLPLRLVLFDDKENAFAVGQTIIPVLPKEGVSEIVVTWESPLPHPPTRIGVYPIFNPFEAIDF